MSKKMKIFGLATLVVLAIGIASLYKTYDYVEHNVNFCQSCHVMERAFYTWQKNVHNGVNCKVCHTQDMPGRMAMALRAVVGKEDVGPHAKLDKTVCEQCHLKTNAKVVRKNILGTIGHEKHVVKNGIQCVTCHFGKLHNTKTTAENCQTCHMKSRIDETSAMSGLSCTDCHAFLAKTKDTGSLKPTKESCLACHEEKNLSPAKSQMQFECSTCHKPHSNPIISSVNCMSQCHVSIVGNKKHSEREIFKGNKVISCTTCHPAHTWKVN